MLGWVLGAFDSNGVELGCKLGVRVLGGELLDCSLGEADAEGAGV